MAKLVEKKVVCPICNGPAIQWYRRRTGKSKLKLDVGIYCESDICGYAYWSSKGSAMESFGFIVFRWRLYADLPSLKQFMSNLKKIKAARKAAIEETKLLLSDPKLQMIFECFMSPNSNKLALSTRVFEYIKDQQDKFPMNWKAITAIKEHYENHPDVGQVRETDYDSDDYLDEGSGSDR